MRILAQLLGQLEAKNICLFTGKHSWSKIADQFQGLFSDFNIRHVENEATPVTADALRVIFPKLQDFAPDVYIAVGGGSVIDLSKLVAALAFDPEGLDENIRTNTCVGRRAAPLFAIPTTAGSGSECTHFAVVYIGDDKFSISHPTLLPDEAIVDVNLTLGLSPYLIAATGMDALSQAVESYWSVGATDESKDHARKAIRLSMANLEQAVLYPTHLDHREAMCLAANFAGKAINISKTTAPHAVSYPLTSRYGITHGHAVGITLAEFLQLNAAVSEDNCTDPRGVEYVRRTMTELLDQLDCANSGDAQVKLEGLMLKIGLEPCLTRLGISTEAEINYIVSKVNVERLRNNPRQLNESDLKNVLLRRMC